MLKVIAIGEHTRIERELILEELEADDIVMELGGGIGMLSIACAQRIGSDRVFSFEANPDLETLVKENYALNDVHPSMSFCMLGRAEGECDFYVSGDFWVSSVHAADLTAKRIVVPVRSFNEVVAKIKPTFLIVDIEGAEDTLFDYADLEGIRKIMLELHPELLGIRRCNAIRRRIRRFGFSERTKEYSAFLFKRETRSKG
jgi:FkbM family methyltransferase